jgi:hypothetical protein
MKYKIELKIDITREKMLVLFQDVDFMKKWQPSFQSLDVLEGVPGEVGSRSRLSYMSNGKTSEIFETIILKELPARFEFSGFMKLFGLMKGMFVKQTTKDMNEFKIVAELEN